MFLQMAMRNVLPTYAIMKKVINWTGKCWWHGLDEMMNDITC